LHLTSIQLDAEREKESICLLPLSLQPCVAAAGDILLFVLPQGIYSRLFFMYIY